MVKKSIETLPKKSLIPYIFFLFFFVIISVNIFFVYISQTTWTGVFSEKSYKKGLNYDKSIDNYKNQQNLGFNSKIIISDVENQNLVKNIKFYIEDNLNRDFSGAKIILELKSFANDDFDFIDRLKSKNGLFQGDIKFPVGGLWNIEVRMLFGDLIYQKAVGFKI